MDGDQSSVWACVREQERDSGQGVYYCLQEERVVGEQGQEGGKSEVGCVDRRLSPTHSSSAPAVHPIPIDKQARDDPVLDPREEAPALRDPPRHLSLPYLYEPSLPLQRAELGLDGERNIQGAAADLILCFAHPHGWTTEAAVSSDGTRGPARYDVQRTVTVLALSVRGEHPAS